MNQNFVGIAPNLAILFRLCPLWHEGSLERLLMWAIRTELETANFKGCPMFVIAVPWQLHQYMSCLDDPCGQIRIKPQINLHISLKKTDFRHGVTHSIPVGYRTPYCTFWQHISDKSISRSPYLYWSTFYQNNENEDRNQYQVILFFVFSVFLHLGVETINNRLYILEYPCLNTTWSIHWGNALVDVNSSEHHSRHRSNRKTTKWQPSTPPITMLYLCRAYDSHDVIKWKYFPCYWTFVYGIHLWIPLTKTSDAEFCCFLWCAPE